MDRRAIGCVFFCISAFLWIGTKIKMAIFLSSLPMIGTLEGISPGTLLAIISGIVGLIYMVVGEVSAIRAGRKK